MCYGSTHVQINHPLNTTNMNVLIIFIFALSFVSIIAIGIIQRDVADIKNKINLLINSDINLIINSDINSKEDND